MVSRYNDPLIFSRLKRTFDSWEQFKWQQISNRGWGMYQGNRTDYASAALYGMLTLDWLCWNELQTEFS